MVAGRVDARFEAGFGGAGQEPGTGLQVRRAEGRPVHAAVAIGVLEGADGREGVEVRLETVGVDEEGHGLPGAARFTASTPTTMVMYSLACCSALACGLGWQPLSAKRA